MVLSKRSASARPAKRAMARWLPKASWIHRRFVGLGVISSFDSSSLWSWLSRGRNIIRCSPKETGLLVLIGGDMPDGENRHCTPVIRLWITCIFPTKDDAGVYDDPLSTNLAA